MSKKFKILIIILSILSIFGCFVLIYYFGATYPVYSKIAKQEFEIPGLNEGFVPQGMCFVEEQNIWLITGYMGQENLNSRIYVVNPENQQQEKYFYITNTSENMIKSHFCGIANYGDVVWLATEGYILKMNLQDIIDVENEGFVNIVSEFDTKTGADFIFANEKYLWVGDFYRDGYSSLPSSHTVKINDLEINKAIALQFEININETNGFNETPILALSIPNQVQGFSQTNNGEIILSTSYSIPNSVIYVYGQSVVLEDKETLSLEFGEIPLKVCCQENLIKKIEAPAMSEGIDIVDNRVYILYESACNKYKFFNRTRINHVNSIVLEDLFK